MPQGSTGLRIMHQSHLLMSRAFEGVTEGFQLLAGAALLTPPPPPAALLTESMSLRWSHIARSVIRPGSRHECLPVTCLLA